MIAHDLNEFVHDSAFPFLDTSQVLPSQCLGIFSYTASCHVPSLDNNNYVAIPSVIKLESVGDAVYLEEEHSKRSFASVTSCGTESIPSYL